MSVLTRAADLREAFLDYFEKLDHSREASSSLVPEHDPTLLFTNAGMVPFKSAFLGEVKRRVPRACSAQRCVRAGGKHNDLENVGYTARHHTFFEMLGNFSFGDYFKEDAIRHAWRFLTEVLHLPASRLWVTVYKDDDEAARIWLQDLGVCPERFSRLGEKDNFWSMGDTGPCGPCSEIFYDHGPDVAGGPPGSPDEDGDRYVEIWNLVFMQFNRDAAGRMTPLPRPSVDTGMGLERLAAVMQGVENNYDTDLFHGLLDEAARLTACTQRDHPSLRVLVDHIRSSAFLVADGVLPGNEGRGYVLRRIIRRAIRHGYRLGIRGKAFLYQLLPALVAEMGEAYPLLRERQAFVAEVLQREEARFAETLSHGMQLLEKTRSELKGDCLPGDVVFQLYDTYGFPLDLTADYAREHGCTVDRKGFERAMEEQRSRARGASRFSAVDQAQAGDWPDTLFQGYTALQTTAQVLAIRQEESDVAELNADDAGILVLDQTPFYAESGGQAADVGLLTAGDSLFRVRDVQKQGKVWLHIGSCERGSLSVGQSLDACVDQDARTQTARNHSATHLLHAALRRILGEHVVQKGSLVQAQRLRFDFSSMDPVSAAQLRAIEDLVNIQIMHNLAVETRVMDYKDAVASGAMALFGEKYSEQVRVLRMGDFSIELCGGTHVQRTGDIGMFRIIQESGIASGVRRIEGCTGLAALVRQRNLENSLDRIQHMLKAGDGQVEARIKQQQQRVQQLEKNLQQVQAQLAVISEKEWVNEAVAVNGMQLLVRQVDLADRQALRASVDRLRQRLQCPVVLLAQVHEGRVALVCGVGKELKAVHAGKLVAHVAAQLGGKGGGRPDMAQGGGSDPAALPQALASVLTWLQQTG